MTGFNFTFQEASPLIKYTDWVEGSSSNDTFSSSYNGSFRVALTDNATASFNFTGTAVSIFGSKRPNHGQYSVSLDQQPLFVASGGTPGNFFNTSLWHADDLPNVEHQVVLTNLPVPQTENKFLDLDFVSIERQIGKDGDEISQITLDDGSPAVAYVGDWTKTNDDRANAGTLHMTTVEGHQAIITFNGCCLELYGHYANAEYSVTLDNQPPVNMAGFDLDPTPEFQHPRTLLYLIDGLSDGNHTATLTNTKSNVNRPFFFDYAVISGAKGTVPGGSPQPGPSTPEGSPATQNGAQNGAHTPVGAIAGGVVGAVAFLALLIIVFWLMRRRRRHLAERERVDLIEGEPKPYILQDHLQVQNIDPATAPQRHTINPGAYLPPSKRQQMETYIREEPSSQEGPTSLREQSGSEGGSGSHGPASSAGSSSGSRSAARRRRHTNSNASHPPTTSETNSQHPVVVEEEERPQHSVVHEEDAGLIESPEEPRTAITLPPAYNPEWRPREDS